MKTFDVIILGSGPAGNTAGIYLVRSGFKACIITGVEVGGQLTMTTDVENFPGFEKPVKGFELMSTMLKQAENLGVEIIYDIVNKVDFSSKPYKCFTENGEEIVANNIIIGTGAGAKYLGLESEKKFIGHGISACATCDGNFFKNKIVAVVGGGRTAAIEALHLSHLVSKVYIIYRQESFTKIEKAILNKVYAEKNIEILFNTEITEVLGTNTPLKVNGVRIKNNKNNTESILELDGVFIAIGRVPRTDLFKNTGLELDAKGYIVTKPDSCRTNIKNVYAVGDVNSKPVKQAVVAAAHGCIAAIELQEDN